MMMKGELAQKSFALITSKPWQLCHLASNLKTLKDSTLGTLCGLRCALAKLLDPWRSRPRIRRNGSFASTALTAMCHYVIGPGMIGLDYRKLES